VISDNFNSFLVAVEWAKNHFIDVHYSEVCHVGRRKFLHQVHSRIPSLQEFHDKNPVIILLEDPPFLHRDWSIVDHKLLKIPVFVDKLIPCLDRI
jgi:hypothetical protein